MDLDQILNEIGDYGRYQQNLLFFVFLPCMFPCAFHAYNQLFMAVAPPNCCNLSFQVEDVSMVKNGSLCTDGYSLRSLTEFSLEMLTKDFVICESDFHLTLALVLFGIAGFIGSYLFGYLQDRIGRRPSFFLYLLIECIFGIATAFATNYWYWLMLRFGVGFTVPAILSTPYMLPIEIVGPKYRTRCTILNNIAYSLGLVMLSGVVYLCRNWRYLAIATSAPFGLFFGYWWFMPESPRWLLASGRFEKAVKILINIAKVNGRQFTDDHLQRLKVFTNWLPTSTFTLRNIKFEL